MTYTAEYICHVMFDIYVGHYNYQYLVVPGFLNCLPLPPKISISNPYL